MIQVGNNKSIAQRTELNKARTQFKMEALEKETRISCFQTGVAAKRANESKEHYLHLGNISFNISATNIVEFFTMKGIYSIDRCEIQTTSNGRSKGVASLIISSEGEVDRVLALDGEVLNGRNLRIKKDFKPRLRRTVLNESVARWPGNSLIVGTLLKATDDFSPRWKYSSAITLELDGRNSRQLALELGSTYRLEFKVWDVVRCCVHAIQNQSHRCVLWMHIDRPPFCYKEEDFMAGLFGDATEQSVLTILRGLMSLHLWERRPQMSFRDSWVRTTDPSKKSVFGHCFTYVMELQASPETVIQTMRDFGIVAPKCTHTKNHLSLVDVDYSWSGLDDSLFDRIAWPIRYALQVLVTQRKLEFNPSSATHIVNLCRGSHFSSAELAERIISLRVLPRGEVYSKLLGVFTDHRRSRLRPPLDGFVPMVRRVLVTPLRVLPDAPEPDMANRVLRSFQSHLDRFVRVTFVDENYASIFNLNRSQDVFNHIRDIIHNGLVLAGDKFEFLAYSNSQLRSQSCWFFKTALPGEKYVPSIERIRQSLGNFNHISVAGRRAARLGQAFSSTTATLKVPHSRTLVNDDVIRNDFVFSDGVGFISPDVADLMASKMRLSWSPSAFQIRYGGAKGVVSVMQTPPGIDMVLRPSMIKFQSTFDDVEVCCVASALPFYLNIQIIPLLSCRGVEDKCFLALLNSMLESLAKCTHEIDQAVTLFEKHESAAPALRMLRAGVTLKDRHLYEWVNALRTRLIMDVQLKARILVPNGLSLIGVLDETFQLPANTVFFQTRSSQLSLPPVGAEVAVGRSPCLHPGDIRVLRRADIPALRHLYDVLVFSSQGERPNPNMMSGGDLDGDRYFVFWEPSLMPKEDFEPMQYDPPVQQVKKAADDHAMGDFFVDFMQNDNLGQLSNAHVVLADLQIEGAKSKECLELAQLCSVAVDFAKTGVPAIIPRHLLPRAYPDFMENVHKPSYESTKVLGKLYRISTKVHWDDYIPPELGAYDERLVVPGYEEYLDDADQQCYDYSTELWTLACKYEIDAEIELVSGYVRKLSRQVCRSRGKKMREDVLERLKHTVLQIKKTYENNFWLEFDNNRDDPHALKKASAWYYTAYTYTWENNDPPYLSFGWLALDPMCRLVEQVRKTDAATKAP
ncbi:hypothetical protein LEN26_016038 [Aphanomyces euteiches]|nr:hypothetical protein LEN26_016038 [Aphanomyces euteiches]